MTPIYHKCSLKRLHFSFLKNFYKKSGIAPLMSIHLVPNTYNKYLQCTILQPR